MCRGSRRKRAEKHCSMWHLSKFPWVELVFFCVLLRVEELLLNIPLSGQGAFSKQKFHCIFFLHQLIERAGRSADDDKVEQKMAESWEELSLVSSSPTMIRKGIEGVVMKHVSKAAKQQKGMKVARTLCTDFLHSVFLLFHCHPSSAVSWPVPTTPGVSGDEPQARVKVQEAPAVRLHFAGPTSRRGLGHTFGVSGSCKGSLQCWLIHLCMCSMFHKASHFGDWREAGVHIAMHWLGCCTHPLEPCIINTAWAWLCTGLTEKAKQAWNSFDLQCKISP